MSFEEPNDPRSSEIVNNQIQLTELTTYEERTPGLYNSQLQDTNFHLWEKSQRSDFCEFVLRNFENKKSELWDFWLYLCIYKYKHMHVYI